MDRIAAASPRQLARIAGGLYLLNILGGFFAISLVPIIIGVSGDAAATAHNIQGNELLYRTGLLTHILITVTNVGLAVIFYELFKVFFLTAIAGQVFTQLAGISRLQVGTTPGDVADITNKLLAHEALFQVGFAFILTATARYVAVTALFCVKVPIAA